MPKFVADENFDNDILRGLFKHNPELDVIRVQDIIGLSGAKDPDLLEWAAQEGRILLTHDVDTMTGYAYERVREGKPMPGVIEVRRSLSTGNIVDHLLVVIGASFEGELEGQVTYVPLR